MPTLCNLLLQAEKVPRFNHMSQNFANIRQPPERSFSCQYMSMSCAWPGLACHLGASHSLKPAAAAKLKRISLHHNGK
eukprot:g63081.t1